MKHRLTESMGHCRAVGVPFQTIKALPQVCQGDVTSHRAKRLGTGRNSPT